MRQFCDAHFAKSQNRPEKGAAAFHRTMEYIPDCSYPDIEEVIRDSNANFQAFVGFKTRV